MDDATWLALTVTLTALGAIWTWFAFRRRGVASGVRGAGLTLLPVAAYLTDSLRMFTRILDAVVDWATGLAFSPVVWSGVVVAGVAVVLLVVSGFLRERELGGAPARTERAADPKAVGRPAKGKGSPLIDDSDDMADIEALLRKRGIS